MKRPDHAIDCPACNGWIGGAALLCVRCTGRVQAFNPCLYPQWLEARATLAAEGALSTFEPFMRGVIIGTARSLNQKKGALARCLLN